MNKSSKSQKTTETPAFFQLPKRREESLSLVDHANTQAFTFSRFLATEAGARKHAQRALKTEAELWYLSENLGSKSFYTRTNAIHTRLGESVSPLSEHSFKKPSTLMSESSASGKSYGAGLREQTEKYIEKAHLSNEKLALLKKASRSLTATSVALTTYAVVRSPDPKKEIIHQTTSMAAGFVGATTAARVAVLPCSALAPIPFGPPACVATAAIAGEIAGTYSIQKMEQKSEKPYSPISTAEARLFKPSTAPAPSVQVRHLSTPHYSIRKR